uniref:Intermediate transcription factor 3 large subunit n=1 Tax=Rousettus bat poxvirus TaxID=3141933 RepID=A0AAU7E259_9POXV
MDHLLRFLHSIEDRYARTIFNFHVQQSHEVPAIYEAVRARIADAVRFTDVVGDAGARAAIKKIIYCDMSITKHVLNHAAFAPAADTGRQRQRLQQHFDVVARDDAASARTREIFMTDRSSLMSYVKTTSRKNKIDYGEIKRTIHSGNGAGYYYSGRRSDKYQSTTVCVDKARPWIKTISKRLRVDIVQDAIITRGKSSILQTIEIIFTSRTCIKVFKNSTVHVILSKDKAERCTADLVDKLFGTYAVLFAFMREITQSAVFESYAAIANAVVAAASFEEKLALVCRNQHMYGIYNFKVGMFNITYTQPIQFTVFPSLLDHRSKIKFFKGKKMNIVALSSLDECCRYVEHAEAVLATMRARSRALDALDVTTASVEELKDLLL